ncbi:MAG TPA: chromosome segregation SMC family protein [Nitrososphaerales archaeon]|jgi:chromosome segregation protein|nr:chromosome segregation SMC family protein [Nitrososphaerales archaeon]
MVFIKKVEARGFKSLGNKTVAIKFNEDFTAITGPNGSGKSNIMDSIMFCLGQNSSKKLRVDRLTSLIFDGTSVKGPSVIRVTVTFDNISRRIPVDSNNVLVTRELRQTGENQYFLNGKRVTKSALSELLNLALISPEGLNMVPQGVITRLSELNPDEKRELIEEIVGVSQFDDKRKRAQEQLNDADTKLQIALARIDEMKNRVDSLENEMNDQNRLKILEDEIRWLNAVITSRLLSSNIKQIEDKKKFLGDYENGKKRLQKNLDTIDKQIIEAENERKEFVSTVMDTSGGKKVELQFAIGKAQSDITRYKEEVSIAKNLIKKIENSSPHLKKMQDQQMKVLNDTKTQIKEEKTKFVEIGKNKKESETTIRQIEAQLTRLQNLKEKKRNQTNNLAKQISKYKETLNSTIHQLEIKNNKRELMNESLTVQTDKAQPFQETLHHLEDQLKKSYDVEQTEKSSFKKVGSSLTGLTDQETNLQGEIDKAIATLSKASDVVLKYEIQKNMAKKIIAHELGLKRLEDLAKTGAIKGYIGRIDKLVSYPGKYKAAVQAAGKRWMNAAVVSDLHTMLKTIEISKRLKIGNITVIPLSEITGSKKINVPKDDGIIGTLADVINCDERLEGLINFLFGDTILVNNSRDGYLVSTKGFKSVTPSGDLFEPRSVAFETGYVAKLDEIMELVKDEASLRVIKEALSSLKSTITKRKSNIDNLQSEAKKLTEEKIRLRSSLERIKDERDSVRAFIKRYKSLNKEIQARLRKTERDFERTNKIISKLNDKKIRANNKISIYETKLSQISTKNISEEIRNLQEKKKIKNLFIEEITNKLRETESQLLRYEGNLKHNLEPSYARLEEQIEGSKSILKEKRIFTEKKIEELKKLSENLAIQKQDVKRTITKSKKSRPILERYETKLRRITKERDGLRKSITNIEKEMISTSKSIEMLQQTEQNLQGELTLYGYTEPIEIFDNAEVLNEQLNIEYQRLKNQVNLLAVSSYREIFAGYKNLSIRRNQLEEERNVIVKFIEEVDSEKKKVFLEGFKKIDQELRIIFSKLTGGSSWLELENPNDIFSQGIFLMAQFPDNKPRESSAVSGGEKTVSALSVILAIQSVYPSPFYLFDEIDAHLDVRYVEKLADLLKEKAVNSQIIAVTLKDTMLTRASLIYGLYKEKGTSKILKYKTGLGVVARSG